MWQYVWNNIQNVIYMLIKYSSCGDDYCEITDDFRHLKYCMVNSIGPILYWVCCHKMHTKNMPLARLTVDVTVALPSRVKFPNGFLTNFCESLWILLPFCLQSSTWILTSLLARIFARMDS